MNFGRAKPVWPTGRGEVWNQMVGFHARWIAASPDATVTLRITGADVYRVRLQGQPSIINIVLDGEGMQAFGLGHGAETSVAV